ncbi:MAG: methylated-DNA--[protein]-cysteine S-methyltransferase [Erysipelotrichaceae bacterium]|nr:methylated-DNA--[protein]-cysteine S-methyltransferase [Erysipelotrichaceae bacterium]
MIHYAVYDTLINDVTLLSNENALTGMVFGPVDPVGAKNEEDTILYDAIVQLNQYFFGQLQLFTIPLFYEGTEFEKKVYDCVRLIPYGHTKTYEEIAKEIGEPNGAKAVANALSHNPIPIFIPDHRVVGENGENVVYSGPIDLKAKLLALEAAHAI